MASGLRIGIIAPPWVSVPPRGYGGTEVVVDQLARGLVRAGHDVVLWSTGDSTCPVDRRWLLAQGAGTVPDTDLEIEHVAAAHHSLADCQIIHDHTFLGPLWAVARGQPVPVAATVHGPFSAASRQLYGAVADRISVIAISAHQRSTAPEVDVRATIHHGIDAPETWRATGSGGYLAFLGRMSPDKGVVEAIRIARTAGRRLLIAAKMWEPAERAYFDAEVAPLLGRDVEYVGQIAGADKVALLAGADALLNPIRWPEPFGLVMIEALGVGTPVIATPFGAAPEIVEHGRTGFICADRAAMVDAVGRIAEIDRSACRRSAVDRFSTARMVDRHVDLYRQLVDPVVRTDPSDDRRSTATAARSSSSRRPHEPDQARSA